MSNASLALYLGESYAEIEVRSNGVSLFNKNYFLPQTSLKNIFSAAKNSLADKNLTLDKVYLVTKYFDRLKSFRLGGSVVQVLNPHHENNYLVENTSKLSLAAASLIISLPKKFEPEFLAAELQRIKKINPDVKKVVLSLEGWEKNGLDQVAHFFQENNFKVFINKNPENLASLRKTLINAGAQGTRDEIVEEVTVAFPEAEINFWTKENFNKDCENIDLFFSADFFLYDLMKKKKKDILIHTDLERWFLLKNETETFWQSPWGEIAYEHIKIQNLGLHPLSEIVINEAGHLDFSATPAAIEPGPMVAGRSVKTLIVDAFFEVFSKDKKLAELFPHLNLSEAVAQKIISQFKVLEKGQIHYDEPFNLEIIQDFIINKLGYDILLFKLKEETFDWTGHFNLIFKKLNKDLKTFSWTDEIFKKVVQNV